MPTFDGTDVSNHQGAAMVDAWDQVVALGGTGGWWKVTEGRTYLDPYAAQHRTATAAAGLRYRGPYHWLSPTSSVVDQFNWFVSHVGDLNEGEAIQLDIEDPAGVSDGQAIECIDRWEARYPGRVLHYMGRFYMRQGGTYLVDRMLARYGDQFRWWLPWYTNTYPGGQLPVEPVMWQWAGGADGVLIQGVGHVDSNKIIDRDRLEAASGYSADPPPPDPPQEVQMLVMVNSQGWWKELVAGQARTVYGDEANHLLGLGIPVQFKQIPDNEWDAWPAYSAPVGPQGPPGLNGVQGPAGATGAVGPPGPSPKSAVFSY
jgi:GH25 family lysozyme M1 (1,4-beta-N-acetylmuramidase)